MSDEPKPREGSTPWIVVAVAAACPLGKLVTIGIMGGVFGITIGTPWIVTLALAATLATAVLVVRRARSKST